MMEGIKAAREMSHDQQYLFHLDMVSTFSGGSGQKVLKAIRWECFMTPTRNPPMDPHNNEQLGVRYGRMTLFQWIEWWLDPANFKHLKPQQKEQRA